MLHAKLVTAGPRGNACRGCETKVRKPHVILKVTSEYNKFTGHPKIDNFCAKCGKNKLKEAETMLKDMLNTLENGPGKDSQLGSRKVRTV